MRPIWRLRDSVLRTLGGHDGAGNRQGCKTCGHRQKTSHDADTEGITGFMYGCAVNILAHVWEHGEELRRWHNGEYDYDGDGVVNPAILTVGV